MTVDCRECGQKFSTLNRIAVYCSKACRAAGRTRTTGESVRRSMADPEKHVLRVARIRARSAAHRAKEKGRGGQRNA